MRAIASPLLDARAGDVWLYSRKDLVSRMIAVKTWSRFTHVEVVLSTSPVQLFSSRIKDGVDIFRPDLSDLALVLRSSRPFNQIAASSWAMRVVGQPYDLIGISAFWFAEFQGKENGRQFCSEACTRLLRAGGIDPFPTGDADAIAPGAFAVNPYLSVVWRSSDEWRRWQTKQVEVA